MAQYTAPLDDMQFLLEQVFEAPSHWERWCKSAEWSIELAGAVLEEAARLAGEVITPLNRVGDLVGQPAVRVPGRTRLAARHGGTLARIGLPCRAGWSRP